MKTLRLILVISMLAIPMVTQAQTVIFNDTFVSGSLSTLNGTSTPGGTASASTTSYDVASTKTGSCAITAGTPGFLRAKLSSGTTAGYMELQALFASTPVQLVNVGDSINVTIVFTNSAGTLLAGGTGSLIDVGLYNSAGVTPLAGSLNAAGLSSATTFAVGNCTNWQGYVAQINFGGAASTIFTRPVQKGTTSANQDLVFSGAGTGLFNSPTGTQIGSSVSTVVTLVSGVKYTNSYTIILTAANTVSITNSLYDSSGSLLINQVGTTGAANTYTNFANKYDGLSIGIANKGTSLNPQMDISRITITTNYYFAPAITGLNNQTIIAGNNATLSPSVTGNPPPGLQWYLSTDGGATSNAIVGATGSSLTLTNVQFSQNNYIYSLVAANVMGTNSSSMTLTVIVTPSITGLFNQAAYVGSNVTINPSVSGVPTPTLQWLTNGVPVTDGTTASGSTIAGSTTSSLSLNNAQAADTGTYSLVASNAAGTVTNSMSLLVSATNVPPVLNGPPNITVIQGNNGTFSATSYYGLPQPTLQWLDPTQTPITDATNASLTLSNVQYSQNGSVYYLIASNSEGSVTNSATLTVILPPTITSQPASLTVTNTQSASFTVAATGVPNPAYQWYKNGSPISPIANSSATNATLVFTTTATDTGSSLYVQVSNAAGTTNSQTVTLTVNSAMSVATFSPANSANNVFYDTPLVATFSQVATLRTNGTIKIYNATNTATPVDTISAASGAVQNRTFPGDAQPFSYSTIVSNGTTMTIYPHFNVLASNQTYYVTIDNGTFADAAGAYFAGISATNVWQFSTKVGGPVNPTNLIVAANGSGDFLTVQGAVNSIPSGNSTPSIINIRNGTYTEIVDVASKSNITFRGQSRLGTLVGYPNNANFQSANNGTTQARMAFKVNANDIALENLTITNMTPQGGSQAEALMINTSAKRCIINNVDLVSRQDTILANVNSSQGYFYNTTVRGNFDYIWGGGNLYFDKCTIQTISGTGSGQLTAARTDTSATTSTNLPWLNPAGTYTANGMSFVGCTFTNDSGLGAITLAGSNGTSNNLVSWFGCNFTATNYVAPSATLFNGSFLFWQNSNIMTNGPVSFPVLTTIGVTNNDPRLLAATNIPTWFYGWTPQLAPNIIGQPANQTVSQGQTANFTVTATGIPNPSYQWLKSGSPISGATGTTLTISNAVRTNAGSYSVVVSNGAGSVTSASATLTYTGNVLPVANPSTYSRIAGLPLTITIAGDLATNWSDADGDPVALSGTISSTNGAMVSYDSNFVYYTNANNLADQITYTVSDGQGGTTNGIINVTVIPSILPPTQNPSLDGNGHPTFSGSGIPAGTVLGIEYATSISGPWANAGSATANSLGNWTFNDTNQTNPDTAFYRIYYPYNPSNPPQ